MERAKPRIGKAKLRRDDLLGAGHSVSLEDFVVGQCGAIHRPATVLTVHPEQSTYVRFEQHA